MVVQGIELVQDMNRIIHGLENNHETEADS